MINNRNTEEIMCKNDDIVKTIIQMYAQTGLSNSEIKKVALPYVSLYNEGLINLNQLLNNIEETIEKRILYKNTRVLDFSNNEFADYSYLIEEVMNELNYDSSLTMDLYNDGYVILISTLKEYNKNGMNIYKANLKRKLKNDLEKKVKQYNKDSILKEKKQNNLDDVIETKDTLNNIMYSIMSERKLTLLQKTILFACLKAESFEGISDNFLSKLTKNSSNSKQCICERYKNALNNVRKHYQLDTKNKYVDSDFNLFLYLRCDKDIVLLSFMDELDTNEVEALKMVWGNDFSKLKNFDEILMNEQQLIDYVSAIRKIYNNIKRMDRDEEFCQDLIIDYCVKKYGYNCSGYYK